MLSVSINRQSQAELLIDQATLNSGLVSTWHHPLSRGSVVPGLLTCPARDAILGGRWRVQQMLTKEAVVCQPFQVADDWRNTGSYSNCWSSLRLLYWSYSIIWFCLHKVIINYNPIFSKYHWLWVVDFKSTIFIPM